MNAELTRRLAEGFPAYFRDLGGDPRKTCMAFGIECGDGWFGILWDLCESLRRQGVQDFKFLQVKEKFGTLRAYWSGRGEHIHELVSKAEGRSAEICEECGTAEGVTTEGRPHWILTLCPRCAEERDAKRQAPAAALPPERAPASRTVCGPGDPGV